MPKSTKSTKVTGPKGGTAQAVRAFYNDPEKGQARIASLPTGTSLASLNPGARGRLHPALIAGYNKGKRPAQKYVSGAERAAAVSKAQNTAAARKAALAAGHKVAAKGPLPKSVLGV